MKKIVIGSYPFFHEYSDYNSHDLDTIVFEENPQRYKYFMNIRLFNQKSDTFYYRDMPKDEFIQYELKKIDKMPMAAGKFLVPELCEYKHITIEDLKRFQLAFDSMDNKHKYEQIIYQSYLENNSFTLTNDQRDKAYKEYKKLRKNN